MTTVGIIGGGPAGLGLAERLVADGFDVSLFEAAPELGGLARSFRFGDAVIERYYHFICGSDDGYFRFLKTLGIEDALRWRHTRMGYYYMGKLYPFSSAWDLLRFGGISLLGRLRYGLVTFYCTLIRDWRHLDGRRAEPWLISLLGEETYRATWYPLLSVKFPGVHDQISAAWVWHRVHRVAKSRKTLVHKERLGYLDGGTQTLIDRIEARLRAAGADLRTATPVRRILIEDGRAVGVETAAGEARRFDYVVSAVPLAIFLRMAPDLPPEYRDRLAAIGSIGVICVTLRLRRPVTENFWTNVNDPRIAFNGFIEYTHLNDGVTADGSAIVYVPFYLPADHERFAYPDRRLFEECLEALALVNPALDRDDVVDYVVSRDRYAQVICPAGFAGQVPGHETPIERLYLIESSQLYPSDRTISGTLDLALEVAELIRAAEASRDRDAG